MTPVDTHIHSNPPPSPFRRPGADIPSSPTTFTSSPQDAATTGQTPNPSTSSPSAAEGVKLAERDAQDNVDGRRLKLVNAATIKPKRVRWLWAPGDNADGRIPMGELTLIVGRGGVGKSTLLCQMAAWITTGKMRGEFYGQPKSVLYVANEDSREYTVVPRLIAAGADLSKIQFVGITQTDGEEGKVLLPRDCQRIGEAARDSDAVAILLDPLASNLAVENTSSQVQMRQAIEAIRRMCEEYEMAAVGLAHTRKAASANLMDALMGSAELGNVCRSAMGVVIDPDEESERTVILSQEKSNLGRTDLDSYKYVIRNWTNEIEGEVISTGYIEWVGKTETKASDVLADQMNNVTTVGECSKWIIDYITQEGPTPRKDVIAAGRKEGFSDSTINRSAKRARIVSNSQGFPRTTVWSLPAPSSVS